MTTTDRLNLLRAAITARSGRWTRERARRIYRAHGADHRPGTARRDLAHLAADGVLTAHGPADGRFYLTKDTTA